MLRVDVAKKLGELALEASFESEGRVTGLFGASGAGKTSLINMIAGLLRPDRGTITLDGETLDDTAKGIHVPAYRRRIGYVFQDSRLFPHLDVLHNLDYGRRMNRLPDDAAQHQRVTDLLDIGHLLDRRPGKLSGGERQRVALGRALLARPRLLLLDEP
ncbi:ATP-binding cassette domain-containing protein, partial [Bradyrhizobium sp.]|uniref:ATP-binding cassette domain-containing protein n=1 Tax=Bradyrhizobium sp. TaxID=376 RepID=UPI003C3C177C